MKTELAICISCRYKFPLIKDMGLHNSEVAKKFWGRVPLKYALALIEFQKDQAIQKVLHSIKYQQNAIAAKEMGKMLGEGLQAQNIKVDALVPVPLHPRRQKERGYNQSELIAEGVSQVLKIPIENKVLKRTQYSITQTGKSRMDRWESIEQIFQLKNPDRCFEQNVLLIDDVLTTGSTMEACAQELLKGPVSSVSVASVSAVL